MRSFVMSPPERVALGVAAVLLALHAAGAGDLLEYRRDSLSGEPWRFITAHLVHIGWMHALLNAIALWVVARLYATDLGHVAQLLALLASAVGTSAALFWLWPEVQWYRGLSGALHGLYFAGAASWLLSERPRSIARLWMPLALFGGGWLKVALEQPAAGALATADWLGGAIVPPAHLAGAACGTLLGALLAATKLRAEQQHAEP